MDPADFVERHGIVLASAKGPAPSVAEWVAGEPIHGSWWGHRRGNDVFRALSAIADSADVLTFRLVNGKITFVHRRLWPALVRLADEIGRKRLTVIRQEHTESGAHRNVQTPFPRWVPDDVRAEAVRMTAAEARARLGGIVGTVPPARRRAVSASPRAAPRRDRSRRASRK